jgi:ankyrin repeat protein
MAHHIDSGRLPKFWGNFKKLMKYLMLNDKYECEVVDFLAHFNSLYSDKNKDFTEYMFDINHTDSREKTLLHHAAALGDLGFVRGLLQLPDIDLNILDKDDCTPLCVSLRE